MGLFSFLGDIIENVVDTVRYVVDEVKWAVEDIFFSGDKSSYSSSTASAQETIDLQAECNKSCKDAEKKTKKAIEEIINRAKTSVKSFENRIKKLEAAGMDVSIPDDYFDSMEDAYLDYIQHEISLDAKEFMKILEIRDDKKRKDECRAYINKVVQEAKRRAIEHLNNKYYDALDSMTKEMKSYLDEKESAMKERKRQLDKLEANKDDEEYVKQVYIDHVIDISYLNCIRSECVG